MISTKKVFTFRSSSSPEKVYTTLLLSDGSTTCNCPGWTRRVGVNGERLCVHTRLVNSGNAEAAAYPRGTPKPQPKPLTPRRKFSFE